MVVVHPAGRFTTTNNQKQWTDACLWNLLAFCNHGRSCTTTTFRDFAQLESFPPEKLENFMETFVLASSEERLERRLGPCPPHIRKNWQLGMARRERMEERKHTHEKVAASLLKVQLSLLTSRHGPRSSMQT